VQCHPVELPQPLVALHFFLLLLALEFQLYQCLGSLSKMGVEVGSAQV
jgi:hypothetical protein